MPQDCAEFGFVYKAHPTAHIEIRVGGCNAVDGPKGKQDVELFFSGALKSCEAGKLADTLTHSDLQVLSATCNLERPFVSQFMNSLIARAVQKGVHNLHSSFLLTAQGDRLPQGIGGFPEPFHISLRCSLNRM
jgi:hypothetical protein